MNRVSFIESVSGIDYPEMLVNFFDHFVALKRLVEDCGEVHVQDSTDTSITFSICFENKNVKDHALDAIKSMGGVVVIYERPISVSVDVLNEQTIQINLT